MGNGSSGRLRQRVKRRDRSLGPASEVRKVEVTPELEQTSGAPGARRLRSRSPGARWNNRRAPDNSAAVKPGSVTNLRRLSAIQGIG